MNQEEINQEILECSRYGEDEDLLELLAAGGDANYADEAGNTGKETFLDYDIDAYIIDNM